MYSHIILAGVAVSLIYYELTGLSPGGIIVPGYIALALHTPKRVLYTIVIALITMLCAKLIGRIVILYGRRRFAVMILLSFFIDLIITETGLLAYDPGLIGVLVPGILAQDMDKQGVAKTLVSLAISVAILAALMMWQGMQVLPL